MTLEKALRYFVLAGVFILPFIVLYVSRSMFFPFITGKNFAFRIIIELVAGGWLALALVNPAYRPRRAWLLWAFGLLVAWMALANAMGVYPFKSFWSNFERMEGWVTLAHLFVYFIVAASVLNTEKLWRYWWYTSLGVSTLVALYGILQFAGLRDISQSASRLDATLGNATYLAVYMLIHIFIAALFFARAWVERGAGKRLAPVLLYGGIIAIDTFVLAFTATRGAILGLIGGAFVAAFLLVVLAPRSRVAWRAGAVVGGLVVLAGAFFLVKDQAWVQKIEPLQRLASISLEDSTTKARFMNWAMALNGFEQRPILGWGQENYAVVFDNNYDPGMWGQEPWFDRAHNIFLDWLIAGGVPALALYLSLYVIALWIVWRSGAFASYERAILTGLFAAYFFHNIFVFDNLISYMLFVAVLAYITVRAMNERPVVASAWSVPRAPLPAVATLTLLASFGTVWFVNADALRVNLSLIQAIQPQAGGPQQNLEYFKEAASYRAAGQQEVREQLVQGAISIIRAEIPADLKQQYVALAAAEMTKQAEEVPGSARFPFFMGIMYDHAGVYADGAEWLKKARNNSPNKQAIIFEQGLNAFARGQNDEAIAFFKEAYELAPEYREARIYYASASIRVGDDATAESLLQPLMATNNAVDTRIASAWAQQKKFDRIISLWGQHVAKNPTDMDARFLLAGARFNAGDKEGAIRELEAAKQASPAVAQQADALIEQIRSGAVQ